MRKRIHPSTLIACLALFFSLTGAGLAASRYLITSTSQIRPSVLHALKGERGPRGFAGATGPQGTQGIAGQAATTSQPYFYVRHVGPATLNAAHPATTINVYCDPGDRIMTGGYDGQNEIVTVDEPLSANTVAPWVVSAHLEQGAASGTVTGWVLCERP